MSVSSRACDSDHRVVILDADRLRADALHRAATRALPNATVSRVASMAQVPAALNGGRGWLLVTSIDIPGTDVLSLLARGSWAEQTFSRRVVVTARREQRILLLLAALELDGIFDPGTEGVARFRLALRWIADGRRYVSPAVLDALVTWRVSPNSLARLLTSREQLVLSIIGDGRDDDAAAEALHLRPSTIQSVRRSLHRKLGVSHKGDLVRVAAQHGFVQFTADGVVQPGFACALPPGRMPARPSPTGDTLTDAP